MITANDLRKGMKIELDGILYLVEEFQHVKRARGGAFVRTRLKDLSTSQIIRRVFQPEEKIKDAFIEQKPAQYLYREGDNFHFMDLETYEERIFHRDQILDKLAFLKENLQVTFQIYEGRVVGVDLPTFVEMKVKKAEPGIKGNTVGSASKPVIVESGYRVQVPLFVKEGDIIRLDTRTGKYIGKK
jgi:elongation factor P